MIFDQLTHITSYKGIHPNLDTAIDFIVSHDLKQLPLGKTEIDGDLVFLNKMEANAVAAHTKQFEVHKKYMDIQIDLSGVERIDTGERVSWKSFEFDDANDLGFTDCQLFASCILGPGNFSICMAGEPHKPGILVTEETGLVKCVLKVQI